MKKPRFALLNMDLIHGDGDDNDENKDFCDTTYRGDGLTIGKDYLRFEGRTVSRGTLDPTALSFEETIGRGAFSKVQRAIWKCQTKAPCEVAIKQYSVLCDGTTQQRRQMLIQELRSLCQMDNPCLIKLHGAFLEEDTVTMVLEYCDKGSLEYFICQRRNNTPFSQPMVAAVTYQILIGLEHLHNHRILHRDIKSENILVHSDGRIKLCDFGLASMGDQSLHKTMVGTTKFMAPERLRAQPYGRSSDIWSFGMVLRHMLTGEKPWDGISSIVDLLVTIEETPVSDLVPDNLEKGLKEILSSSLKHAPTKRMPAKVLLKSPCFSVAHRISQVTDAMKIVVLDLEEEESKCGTKRRKNMDTSSVSKRRTMHSPETKLNRCNSNEVGKKQMTPSHC